MNKNYLIIVFIIFFNEFFAQKIDTIIWRKTYKLEWADFKSKEPLLNNFPIAESHIDFSIDIIQITRNTMQISIYPVFHKDKSFKDNFEILYFDSMSVKNARKNILEHERLHFDIAELVCRRIRKKIIDSLKEFDCNDIQNFRYKWYTYAENMSNKIQKKYDKEVYLDKTNKQNEWNIWVEEELLKMELYSKQTIIMKCL